MKLLLLLLVGSTAFANFPPKLTVVLKGKMSCREIKRNFQRNRLFVYCDDRTRLVQEFSAEYFGKAKVKTILHQLRSYPKVAMAEMGSDES